MVEFLEYMNDNIYYPRNIAWKLVEFSDYKWVEISLTEVLHLSQLHSRTLTELHASTK